MIRLLAPLIVEQIVAALAGMVGMVVVAAVGESAVSDVSLVDSIGVLVIQTMGALATGGAVISTQYLNKEQPRDTRKAAGQLILVTMLASTIIADAALVEGPQLLGGIFGKVEQDVMGNAQTYFQITALSCPFIGLYNACAALFRSMDNSKVSMMTPFVMNMINIIGSVICVLDLEVGMAGMAWPTPISHATAAFMMFVFIQSGNNSIRLNSWKFLILDRCMIKNILSIGIPNGLENGVFQFDKIFLQSLMSFLETVSIASFTVASNLVMILYPPGNAIGLGLVTMVDQCIDAGRLKETKNDAKSLILVVYGILAIFSTTMVIWSDPLVGAYHLFPRAALVTRELLLIHSIAMIIWPLTFIIPHTLRAPLDAKFTMAVSAFSMRIFRIGFTYLFVHIFNLGLSRVWYGIFIDQIFRALTFSGRLKGFEKRARIVE